MSETSLDESGGERAGGENACSMAPRSVMRSTLRWLGYERVKIGWKIPAR